MKRKSLYAGVLSDTRGHTSDDYSFSAGDYLIYSGSLYRFLKVFVGQLNPVVNQSRQSVHRATMRNRDHRCRLRNGFRRQR